MMSSKKTVLKITPNTPVSARKRVKRTDEYLKECISTILKREYLHLDFNKILDILSIDLHLNLRNVTPCMKYILSECFCYYMKSWPGWEKYETVCVTEKMKIEHIEKFKEYLKVKIKYIIENEHLFNPVIRNDTSKMVSKAVQTLPICKKRKPEAPYSLVISGQPNILNNIVFIEANNDIVIKQHAEKLWQPLNVEEFLNYSFVFVSIKLPDIELSRSNLHEYQRYITECGDIASCPDIDFITYIRKDDLSKPKVYTMDYIHAYFKQFIETIGKIPGVNTVKKTELEEVFRQFILDIQESNVFSCTQDSDTPMNTMATNTSVCFNIGGKTYIRNKKMVVNTNNQKESNAINFCEILIPRMAYTLSKFTAEEDITTYDTSFKSLNEINLQKNTDSPELLKFIEAVNNCISYQCLLCPKEYSGDRAYIDILDHYRFLHKGEQSVLCFICRKQFLISRLAGLRWSHKCLPQIAEVNEEKSSVSSSTVSQLKPRETSNALSSSQIPTPNMKAEQIMVNDNLNSGSQSILEQPSIGNQNLRIVTPVISISNDLNRTTNTSNSIVSTNATILKTLPVVNTLATVNSVLPNNSVLLAIAPSSIADNFINTTIICKPNATNCHNTLSTLPVIPLSLKNIVQDVAKHLNNAKQINNIVNTDPIYIDDDDDDILNTNFPASLTSNYGDFHSLCVPTPSVKDNVVTLTATSMDLTSQLSTPSVMDNVTTLTTTSDNLLTELSTSSAMDSVTTFTTTSMDLTAELSKPPVMDNITTLITTSKNLTTALSIPSAIDNVTTSTTTSMDSIVELSTPSLVNNVETLPTVSIDFTAPLSEPSVIGSVTTLATAVTDLQPDLPIPSVLDSMTTTSMDLATELSTPCIVDTVAALSTASMNIEPDLTEVNNVPAVEDSNASFVNINEHSLHGSQTVVATSTSSKLVNTLPVLTSHLKPDLPIPSVLDSMTTTSMDLATELSTPCIVDNVAALSTASMNIEPDLTEVNNVPAIENSNTSFVDTNEHSLHGSQTIVATSTTSKLVNKLPVLTSPDLI